MYLREVCKEDFITVHARWTIAMARHLTERVSSTHVIVHRTEPKDYFYLYEKPELLHLLRRASEETLIEVALDLHEHMSTPAYDGYENAAAAPQRCIITQDGRVVGFYEKPIPLSLLVKRGVAATIAQSNEPVARSLNVEFPDQVPLGESASLLVSLVLEGGSGINLPVALPKGAVIDVVVQPKRGFVVEGTGEGSVTVDDPQGMSILQFKLTGVELGVGKITVFAFHQQQPVGSITLAPTVLEATKSVGQSREHRQVIEPRVRIVLPDLVLMIFEDSVGGRPSLSFRLTARDSAVGLNMKKFGPLQLRVDPLGYFREFFGDIEKLPLGTDAEREIAERKLASKGYLLFETLVPTDLQPLLWSLRNQIKSVHIQSEEPWIPWEMCKLEGKSNGRLVEGPFFCEAFAMSRWIMGIGSKPGLTLNDMALVMPRDSGLASAASEGSYLLSLADRHRKVTRVSATYLDVIAEMSRGEHDGWHFTGHGSFSPVDPNRSVLLLEGGQSVMPEDLTGVVKNVGNTNPFVFLNACQVGRGAFSLTGIGGWAARFLDAGAGAFVGAHWSVYDQAAQQFSTALYGRLLGGMGIGKAVQEARLAIRLLKDPTWLAYTVFADPAATIQ